MKAIALALMLAVGSYGLMSKEKLNDQTIPAALNEIEGTFFGKTLLDVIQIQLHAKGAIQMVVDLLDEIAEDLRNAQTAADAAWTQRSSDCDSQRTSYEGIIRDATNSNTAA